MKLKECAEKGISRVAYVRDGKSIWNPYSFGDIAIFEDGSYGPWMKVYDPCGQLACGNPAWKPIDVLTIPSPSQVSVEPSDEFEAYVPPSDMDRFPDCPPLPTIIRTPARPRS